VQIDIDIEGLREIEQLFRVAPSDRCPCTGNADQIAAIAQAATRSARTGDRW